MAKRKKTRVIDVTKPIPEWGLSKVISTAVPIAVSGAEIKSTRDISRGMQKALRERLNEQLLREARNLVAHARRDRRSKAVFRNGDVVFAEE